MHDVCLYGLNPGSIPPSENMRKYVTCLGKPLPSHLSDNSYNQTTITDHHRPSPTTPNGRLEHLLACPPQQLHKAWRLMEDLTL